MSMQPSRPAAGPYYDRYQISRVREAQNYMVTHLDDPLTIEALAHKFQMSPTLFKSCFRQVFGEPVHVHLQRSRLEEAARRLRETNDTVFEIAEGVGYSGVSRFGVIFKQRYGLTPGQYRRTCRAEAAV